MAKKINTIPGITFPIIKPLLGFRDKIEYQIKKYPFEKNVFLMIRFRKENKSLSDFIITTLSETGLNGVRADQAGWNITNNVYNPIAVLYCCKYGIAVFDKAERYQAYNPNVIYELGFMHNLGRECLILKNDTMPDAPFDLIKDLYMPYRMKKTAKMNIQVWLQNIAVADTGSRPGLSAGSSEKENTNIIVETPNNVSASGAEWKVKPDGVKHFKVVWSVTLANKNPNEVKVKIHTLILDKKGFALNDYVDPVPLVISTDTSRYYKSSIAMGPDLVNRIQRLEVKVLLVR